MIVSRSIHVAEYTSYVWHGHTFWGSLDFKYLFLLLYFLRACVQAIESLFKIYDHGVYIVLLISTEIFIYLILFNLTLQYCIGFAIYIFFNCLWVSLMRQWDPKGRNHILLICMLQSGLIDKEHCMEWEEFTLYPSRCQFLCLFHLIACSDSFFSLLIKPACLEKEMATHSSILAWEIPWAEEPGRLQSVGLQRIRTKQQVEAPS